MPEPPIRLYLPHSLLDALLPRSDQDLLERKETLGSLVPDQVDEGEAALAEELFDCIGPAVYLEGCISGRCQLYRLSERVIERGNVAHGLHIHY